MTSLTEVMYKTRLLIKTTFFVITFTVIGWNIYKIAYTQYRKAHPLPPPPPTLYYGKLQNYTFPVNPSLPKDIQTTYKITATRERQLKNQIGYVLIYLKNKANIWGPETLATTARQMGFPIKEGRLKDKPTWVRFYDQNRHRTLDIDETSGYFDINLTDSTQLKWLNSPFNDQNQVLDYIAQFLSSAYFINGDLQVKYVQYYRYLNDQKIKVDTITDAQLVYVAYQRQKIFDRPVYFGLDQPIAEFEIGQTQQGTIIAYAKFRYRPVFIRKPATYPLISPRQSWEYIKQGKGLIIRSDPDVVIDQVQLAFYDPLHPYKYMFPVYVFSSSQNNFLAISSALPEKWLELKKP